MEQLVASKSSVVLGGVVEVVGSNLARGKIFTASIGSVDLLKLSVFIYCVNLHQFLILCSSKAMMFVKLYFSPSEVSPVNSRIATYYHYTNSSSSFLLFYLTIFYSFHPHHV